MQALRKETKIVNCSAGTIVNNKRLIFMYKSFRYTFINYGDIAYICVDEVVKNMRTGE